VSFENRKQTRNKRRTVVISADQLSLISWLFFL
jgi:hypothetical protein